MIKTGNANLPLHGGKAPYWLMNRMKKLSLEISRAIIEQYGEKRLMELISDPYWFQAFGSVLGFDWHSSGLTTTVTASLKSLNKQDYEIRIAGGKGKARTIPEEIEKLSEEINADAEKIKYYSRMAARVDSNLVQDGFDLYHHSIIFNKRHWVVVQQGKNESWARRYHWLSTKIESLTVEPQKIASNFNQSCLDLTFKNNEIHQKTSVDLLNDNPEHFFKYFKSNHSLNDFASTTLNMPKRHYISDVDLDERSKKALKKAYEIQPKDYEELVSLQGIGKKSLRALALVSEIINSKPLEIRNPVKFSFAHGGKDGTPFPVNRTVYDKTITILHSALDSAKLGKKEKLKAINRLSRLIKEN